MGWQYRGAFHLPQGHWGDSVHFNGFDYGGAGLAVGPTGESLFIVGHDQSNLTAEISIPTLGQVASVIQPLTDALQGRLPSINPSDPNKKLIGAQVVVDGWLYISAYSYYDGAGTQAASLFRRSWPQILTDPSIVGPTRVGTLHPSWVSRLFVQVPEAWRATFGPWLIGGGPGSTEFNNSFGPTLSTWTASPVLLVGYPPTHPTLGPWQNGAPANPRYNMRSEVAGAAFVGDSIYVIGTTGFGPSCYSGPGVCYDPADPGGTAHAYPYGGYVWKYRAQDLAAVKAGTMQPWDVVPETFKLDLPTGDPNNQRIVSACYDPATRRLFVSQYRAEGDRPVIHVFEL